MEQRRQESARQNGKVVGDRLDRDDDFVVLRRARQDTLGRCMERVEAALIVVPVNENHEGYFAVPGSPVGQLFARRRIRQDGVDVILVDQSE